MEIKTRIDHQRGVDGRSFDDRLSSPDGPRNGETGLDKALGDTIPTFNKKESGGDGGVSLSGGLVR